MIFLFEDDWIETKDSLTLKAIMNLKDGRVIKALSSVIVAWSEDKPINEFWVGQLKYHIALYIINFLIERYNKTVEQRVKVENLARLVVKGLKIPRNSPDFDLYDKLMYFLPCIDGWGNIKHLPEAGGLLDQRADYMFYLVELQNAVAEKVRK